MHRSTEDLLTLRDSDAADADKLARLRAAPGAALAVTQLERMRDALRALPELDPPAGSWEAFEARLAAPATATDRVVARSAVAARALGAAAALALAVIAVLATTTLPSSAPDLRAMSHGGVDGGELLGDSLRGVEERLERTVVLPPADGGVAETYARLQQESAALEEMLGAISFQRAAMSGATASAIVALEDRIATIDAFMVSSMSPAETQAVLMGVRNDLLAALVTMRLAQAQRLSF